ncbi:MAG: flavodoxin family protein [Planctomycetes bacterium]|nr:flavodoxin family protein [Planctomycetota bacterium]
MATIAIVYHSGFGHTKAIAEHVAKGARAAGAAVHLVPVADLPPADANRQLGGSWPTLAAADAIIFGTPTYMGTVSAKFKEFMETSSGVWFTQGWKDKLAAGFTNSGGLSGDKLNALTDLAVFAGQHSMIWVSQGLFYTQGSPDDPKTINRLGSWLGLMTQADNAGADVTPPVSDRATAEAFGARVAAAAARWASGKA